MDKNYMPDYISDYIPLEEAQKRLLEQARPVRETEPAPLLEAMGRVAGRDLSARVDYPPFDRSPLDGYALIAADTAPASPDNPAKLAVTQCVFAGDTPSEELRSGQAARVMTGAMLPPGADCVVRQEDTDGGETVVSVYKALRAKENFISQGEDILEGQLLLPKGTLIDFTSIGSLSVQGYAQIPVYRRLRVAVVSTGDELVPEGTPLPAGKIYDSNGRQMAARAMTLGADVTQTHCEDEAESLCDKIRALMNGHDIVLTSGGVSVGQKDCVPAAARRLGGTFLFHGISVKPGSSALAVAKDGKLLIALSGNPFAMTATMEALAVPAIRKMSGQAEYLPLRVKGILQSPFGKAGNTLRLVQVRLVGQTVVFPNRGRARQDSRGAVSTLAGCNAILEIPPGAGPLAAGDEVDVSLF
jgi:molybdopterin molybdotransferase